MVDPVAITTVDNPYNPFTQFDEWYAFDEQKGYHTCSYLGRIALTSYDLSDEEQDEALSQAIDEILHVNGLGFYKKVHESDYKKK